MLLMLVAITSQTEVSRSIVSPAAGQSIRLASMESKLQRALILDIVPTELHQRVHFICGNTQMVKEVEALLKH